MEQLIDFFNDKEVNSVLDVGTGTGNFIDVLKTVFPTCNVTGVDPDKASLEQAAERFPDARFWEMGAERLAFNDDTFDLVSMSMALHHLPEVDQSMAEMKRVVKPEGWIVINELFSDHLNKAQEVHKFYHHFRSRIDRILGNSHNETFTRDEIIAFVEKSGVRIVKHFENHKPGNLIETKEDLEERIEKMRSMLDEIKGYKEYDELKSLIAEFEEKANRYGFEMATRIVVIGKAI